MGTGFDRLQGGDGFRNARLDAAGSVAILYGADATIHGGGTERQGDADAFDHGFFRRAVGRLEGRRSLTDATGTDANLNAFGIREGLDLLEMGVIEAFEVVKAVEQHGIELLLGGILNERHRLPSHATDGMAIESELEFRRR